MPTQPMLAHTLVIERVGFICTYGAKINEKQTPLARFPHGLSTKLLRETCKRGLILNHKYLVTLGMTSTFRGNSLSLHCKDRRGGEIIYLYRRICLFLLKKGKFGFKDRRCGVKMSIFSLV